MTTLDVELVVGTGLSRVDGRVKVLGEATYAFEQDVPLPAYAHLLQSTVARGRVTEVDASEADALDGVLLVLTHLNAPELADTIVPTSKSAPTA